MRVSSNPPHPVARSILGPAARGRAREKGRSLRTTQEKGRSSRRQQTTRTPGPMPRICTLPGGAGTTHTMHPTPYTIHPTTHYTVHSTHYTPHTTHYTLHTTHRTLQTTPRTRLGCLSLSLARSLSLACSLSLSLVRSIPASDSVNTFPRPALPGHC